MSVASLVTGLVATAAAVLVGTFVEYWGHRIMHVTSFLRRHHARHHQRGSGQGWLGEFRDYFAPTSVIIWVGFLHSTAAGVGFVAGTLAYAAVAAYAHQLQHERPGAVFWMPQPLHSVHHYHQEWHHNFGITIGLWDHVFGTYRQHEPVQELLSWGADARRRFAIRVTEPSAPLPRKRRRSA